MKIIVVFFILLVSVHSCSGQSWKLMRYEEDHSTFKDSTETFYSKFKHLPITKSGNVYVSFGGGVRAELDQARNEDWGARNAGKDKFILQRYDLHADLHVGEKIRLFGQLRSGLENGRNGGPRPIDEDQLNVQNLFLDLIPLKASKGTLALRLGRQEIQYGSGRLIDVREGPNLRLYFDGVKAVYTSAKWRLDGFVFAHGRIKNGVLDNQFSSKSSLWGVYSTYADQKIANIDLYYLGIERVAARFDEGTADESRHTFGIRLWNTKSRLFYNFEVGYQLGKFGEDDIGAWGGSSEIGYRFSHLKGSPALKLRSDFISGDDIKGDRKLGAFNALYPNGGYFGMNPQAGPGNLLSLHPNLAWTPLKNVVFSAETVFYWRQSLQDGIYRPDGTFNLSSSGSDQRYIGTAYISTVSWAINKFLSCNIGVQYFKTGAFINDIIPNHQDGLFISSLMAFKF